MSDDLDVERLAAFLLREEAADRFSGSVVIERMADERGGAEARTVLAGAYGHAHLGLSVRNTLETRFNTASITKMLTTVAVLRLIEQGLVSLQTTVDEVLPGSGIGRSEAITIDHLLAHRSGLGDYWNDRCIERRSTLRTARDYLAIIEGQQPSFEPGSAVAYGNSGHVVLGSIIEEVSGQDYYEHLVEHVCRPAGMARAGHLHLDAAEDFAHGYTTVEWQGPDHPGVRTDNIFQYPVRGSAATGLYSSAPELMSFLAALLSYSLIGPASVASMFGDPGYGTQRIPSSLGPAVGHGGRAFGAATSLFVLPDAGYEICILSNYDRPADKLVFAEFERLLADG